MKAFGYIRVSTVGQAKKGESLAEQEDAIRKWADEDKKGYELKLYTDRGISGKETENRHEYMRMLQDARKERPKFIVFKTVSRMGRSAKFLLELYDECDQLGIGLVSLDENWPFDTTTATGKMVRGFLTIISEFERNLIIERSQSALHHRRQKGKVYKNPEWPYVFEKDGEGNKIPPPVPDPEKRKIFLDMVSMYLDKDMGLLQIRDWLNKKGITAPRGQKWNMTGVSFVLTNSVATGKYILDRNAYGQKDDRGNHEKDEMVITCEALISEATQEQIKEKLRMHNKRPRNRGTENDSRFLKGLIKCGWCGSIYRVHGKKYACYARYHYKALEKPRCRYSPIIDVEKLERYVWSRVLNAFVRFPENWIKKWVESLKLENTELQEVETKIKNLTREKSTLERQIRQTENDLYNIDMLPEVRKRFYQRINEKQALINTNNEELYKLESRKTALERTRIDPSELIKTSEQIQALANKLWDKLEELSPRLKRQVLMMLIKTERSIKHEDFRGIFGEIHPFFEHPATYGPIVDDKMREEIEKEFNKKMEDSEWIKMKIEVGNDYVHRKIDGFYNKDIGDRWELCEEITHINIKEVLNFLRKIDEKGEVGIDDMFFISKDGSRGI